MPTPSPFFSHNFPRRGGGIGNPSYDMVWFLLTPFCLSCLQKKEVSKNRVEDQKAVDKALIANIKKVEFLASYLATSFSLRKGDKPHEMKW